MRFTFVFSFFRRHSGMGIRIGVLVGDYEKSERVGRHCKVNEERVFVVVDMASMTKYFVRR